MSISILCNIAYEYGVVIRVLGIILSTDYVKSKIILAYSSLQEGFYQEMYFSFYIEIL